MDDAQYIEQIERQYFIDFVDQDYKNFMRDGCATYSDHYGIGILIDCIEKHPSYIIKMIKLPRYASIDNIWFDTIACRILDAKQYKIAVQFLTCRHTSEYALDYVLDYIDTNSCERDFLTNLLS